MLYHRATHAMHAWPIESCDTATKRPACSNNNTFCTDTLARLVWGVAVEWGYIHVAWSTWNSGLGLLPSPVSHYSLSATRGARTYPLQRASLACRHAWVLVRIGLDGSPPLSQAASHRSAAACGVCVCDASFHCAPSTSPLCSFIWRKCRYCDLHRYRNWVLVLTVKIMVSCVFVARPDFSCRKSFVPLSN